MLRTRNLRSRRAPRRALRPNLSSILRLEDRTLLSTGPIISEFVGSNDKGLAAQDGSHPDWLELYNPLSDPVDLQGWGLTDDIETPNKWLFPATTLAPGGFLVVFASGLDRAVPGQELHTNFKISAGGGYLALDRPDGTVESEFAAYPQQVTDISYGVGFQSSLLVSPGSASVVKVPATSALESTWATPGYTPDASWTPGRTGVGYGILQPGFSVRYVQSNVALDSIATTEHVLATPSTQIKSVVTSSDTVNFLNTGGGGNFAGDQTFPSQTINQDVDNFAIEATALVSIPTAGIWSFGVNSDDGFSLTLERNGKTLAFSFDGYRAAGDSIQIFSVPEAGQWKARLVFFEAGGGAEVEFYAASGSHPSFDGGAYRLVGDTESGGLAAGSLLSDDPGDSALVGRFVADDLNAMADNATVSAWTDRSGTFQAIASGAPKLQKSALNGHSSIRFDPTDGGDNFRIPGAMNPLGGAGDFTAAIVFRTSTAGIGAIGDWWSNTGLIDTDQVGSTQDWGLSFNASGQVGGGIGDPDVSAYSRTKGLNDGKAHLAVITRSGGVLSVYVDGRLEAERDDASAVARNIADLVFGSIQTGAGHFIGEIAEVRLYGNDLSASQVTRLANELDQTYGLPGVATPTVATDVRSAMQGVNSTLYVRIPFESPDPSAFDALTLTMQYDDGFVAYLNGVEVARANAPTTIAFNSKATSTKGGDPSISETFSITAHLNLLHAGTNLLAIRGLNVASGDEDFLIRPQLVASKLLSGEPAYFATPTPGAPNGQSYLGVAEAPTASVPHGFYTSVFTVSLSTPTVGAQIRYSLDGSEPGLDAGLLYTAPITISGTTTLRMIAVETGFLSRPSTAATYLFLDDILTQSPDGSPPPGWPSGWGGNEVDYGMDPDIVNSPTYGGAALKAALKAIPTLSIVTPLPDLFDPSTGIYSNARLQGKDWEREASVELINPDGSAGFQIEAGLRIRGGYSRDGSNPKHSFRIFFRGEYGASSLVYPLFGAEGAGSFAKIDLRTAQNYSWSFGGDPSNNMVAEVVNRDAMRAMGAPSTNSRWYHLYIDGQYWGLFQTEERPEANFAASYLGGDSDNYDVIKVETGPYTTQATDGNFDAWDRLWQAATDADAPLSSDANYQRLQGKNPDGSDNPDLEVLVDVDNTIQYMVTILYGGNLDAPISAFLGNTAPNNFFAIRDRTGRKGFQFIVHDAEHTFLDINENRNGPFPAGEDFPRFNPQYLHQQLMANAEYRQRFADVVQKQFFNDGVFTAQRMAAMFEARADELDPAMLGESARWGDAKRPDSPLTIDDWRAAVNRVIDQYIPVRTGIVLDQFRAVGLFPTIAAPTFLLKGLPSRGGDVKPGDLVTLSNSGGLIYYTTDGTDPRLPGGDIRPGAILYDPSKPSTPPISLTRTSVVTARSFLAGQWSAVDSVQFDINVPASSANLAITEFDYHPHPADPAKGELVVDKDEFEYIELKNLGSTEIKLAGVRFTAGISFDFTGAAINTLAPGGYLLLVKNPDAFASRYGIGLPIAGSYASALGSLNALSNAGELITIIDASGATIETFTYDDIAPWPVSADGDGSSLVNISPTSNPNDAKNWRASVSTGGNPGASDNTPPGLSTIAAQTINEDSATGDLAFTVSDLESEASAISVTATSNNSSMLPAGTLALGGSGSNRTLKITPAANAFGVATITIAASDGQGGTSISTFLLTVSGVNDEPVGISDSYSIAEDSSLVVPALSGVLANDTDADGDPLTAILGVAPIHGTLALNSNGSFTYVPSANYHGPDSFTYRPSDSVATSPFVTVSLAVNSVPDPVILNPIGDRTLDEGVILTFSAIASDGDLPDDTLTFSLDAGFPAGASIDSKTGAFTWTPTEAQGPGTYSITVRVTDTNPVPSTAISTFKVTVNEVNAAPVVSAIGSKTINEATLLAFSVVATDDDLPKQTITYSLEAGFPAGAAIDSKTGAFTWTPTEAQGPGTFNITVKATDNGSTPKVATSTFTVTVSETNSTPVLDPIADLEGNELSAFTFTAIANDVDLPKQTIVYSLGIDAPDGAIIDPVTGVFTWTPTEAQGPKNYTFNVYATDSASPGATGVRTVTIRVFEKNQAPKIDAIPAQTVIQGETVKANVTASDLDLPGNGLSFQIDVGSPAGVTLTSTGTNSAFVAWAVPSTLTPGVYSILVRVRDDGTPSLSSTSIMKVTVNPPPPPPVVEVGDVSVPVALDSGGTLNRTGRTSPGSTASVNFGDGSGEQPLAVSADGSFTLAHVYLESGAFSAVVRVKNAAGLETSATISVNVAAIPLVTITPGLISIDKKKITTINLSFTGDVSSTGALSRASYRITTAGKDKKFGTKDDKVVAFNTLTFDSATRAVKIGIKKKLPTGAIRLTIASSAITDAKGRAVDGNRDGQAGGNFVANLGKRSLTIASAFRIASHRPTR